MPLLIFNRLPVIEFRELSDFVLGDADCFFYLTKFVVDGQSIGPTILGDRYLLGGNGIGFIFYIYQL